MVRNNDYTIFLSDLTSDDVPRVGGKNASLGEMIGSLAKHGIRVPDGFATTAEAYRDFLRHNSIDDKIASELEKLSNGGKNLEKTGKKVRKLFLNSEFPQDVETAIRENYRELSGKYDTDEIDIAVRSSATAEDLPEASFAGQQETFLNVSGEEELLEACRKCYASLFTDRAIAYREEKGFDHMKVALSIGVQKMVRSDKAGSGVLFTIDTETGFPDVVVIDAAWGLGENVVQGTVNPDEYRVFKPLLSEEQYKPIIEKTLGDKERKMVYAKGGSKTTKNVQTSKKERREFVLSDDEILKLARWGQKIEEHYDKPMDIEWARDGNTGELFIVQARPETVQSQKESGSLKNYTLRESGDVVVSGLAIGEAIASGKAMTIDDPDDRDKFEDGAVLVTGRTDPDWVPIMKRASGIVTDLGGRTSHAAIVSRELGVPAIVGAEDATEKIEHGQEITLSCAEGENGNVYDGLLEFDAEDINLEDIPDTKTDIKMNIASPAAAFRWWRLDSNGIGLARMEYIVNNIVKAHPMALVRFDTLKDKSAKKMIRELTRGFENKSEYFVEHLARGIARIAAPQYPSDVIVRMSDFKTNEYADLIGGREFEPDEENPMLGFRGASRYYSDEYREAFALECAAIRRVREEIGMTNVVIMIPFCRTPDEADRTLDVLADNGLERGKKGLRVFVMCEIPSNVILAEEFAKRFDGFSIGSNDLTQLVLGVDRDSAELSDLFDEKNDAVKQSIADLIATAKKMNVEIGICGQAPSDHPDFAEFLVREGIDSISLNPDSVVEIKNRISELEDRI